MSEFVELFSNNFGAWLEANGLPIEVRRDPSDRATGHALYSPGPIDLNCLKVAVYRLVQAHEEVFANDDDD